MCEQLDGFTTWMNPNIKRTKMVSWHQLILKLGELCMKLEFFMQASNKSFTFEN